MATYDSCPKCGRTDYGVIYHCDRCGMEFCDKCIGKRTLPDGTKYECCPRCGAELDEDEDTIRVVAKRKVRR